MNLHPGMLDCSTPQAEYWSHVADQHELPIAPGKDLPRSLNLVDELATTLENGPSDPIELIAESLLGNPDLLDEIRIFAGWSDKRLYLSLSYVFSRTVRLNSVEQLPLGSGQIRAGTLCGCPPFDLVRHSTSFFKRQLRSKDSILSSQSAEVIARLLSKTDIIGTLRAYSSLSQSDRHALLKNLVFTKESQQNEAKRRGHGAEALIAEVLCFAACEYTPKDKTKNPMGSPDPNIDMNTLRVAPRAFESTMSCDIAALGHDHELRAWIVGLVQSSDPGQFGVDKSNTTTVIRRRLDEHNIDYPDRQIQLWGIVDGVGYSENKNGTINRMLMSFHQFFQVKSAYKAALAAHSLGIGHIDGILFDRNFYESRTLEQMCRYVPADVEVLDAPPNDSGWRRLDAGMASIFRRIEPEAL